jgi:hypothetical protein
MELITERENRQQNMLKLRRTILIVKAILAYKSYVNSDLYLQMS